jgi:hypothetical protein
MTVNVANAKVWNGSSWVQAVAPLQWPQNTDRSGSIAVNASSTIHTKGAWVELIASTTATSDFLYMQITNQASNTDTSSLVDIGIGASGSETVLVADVGAGYAAVSGAVYAPYVLPVRISSGTRIAARSQSIISSRAVSVAVTTGTLGIQSPTSIDTLGAVTASSRGTNLPTSNTYVQIVASTSRAYQAILMMPAAGGATAIASEDSTYTLGIGAAGAETTVTSVTGRTNSAEIVGIAITELPPLYVGDIPAGSRLAVKQSVGRTYRDVILYGVPA